MSRFAKTFQALSARKEPALVIYLCAGDPDLETSYELFCAAARGGADVLEIGVPFSDPTADGPTIQAASQRALASGTHLEDVLTMVAKVLDNRGKLGINSSVEQQLAEVVAATHEPPTPALDNAAAAIP